MGAHLSLQNIWEHFMKSGQNLTFSPLVFKALVILKANLFVNISWISSGLKQSLSCLSIYISFWVLHFCSAVTLNLLLPMTSCWWKVNQSQPACFTFSVSEFVCVSPVSTGVRSSVWVHMWPTAVYHRGLCKRQLLLPGPQLHSSRSAKYVACHSNTLLICARRDGICTDWSHQDKRSVSTEHSSTTQDPDIKLILP